MRKSLALLIIFGVLFINVLIYNRDINFIALIIITVGYFIVKQLEENKNK